MVLDVDVTFDVVLIGFVFGIHTMFTTDILALVMGDAKHIFGSLSHIALAKI